MVFFLAEIDNNPDSESKSVVKHYILSGLLLVLIASALLFFVFKFKKTPAHSGQDSKVKTPESVKGKKESHGSNPGAKTNTKEESESKLVKNPSVKKTEPPKSESVENSKIEVKVDVQTENRPDEKKDQGANDSNPDVKANTKENSKTLPPGKEENSEHGSSKPIENPPAVKTEAPKPESTKNKEEPTRIEPPAEKEAELGGSRSGEILPPEKDKDSEERPKRVDSPVAKEEGQEVKALNPDGKVESQLVINSEHVGNPPAENKEEPKQIKLESVENSKIEAKVDVQMENKPAAEKVLQSSGEVAEPAKEKEKKDSSVENKEAIEQVQAKPAEKTEAPKPESDEKKDLQVNPGEVAELAKATEEKERLFKQIEEQLEKVKLPVLESRKKEIQQEIQQRIQMAVSVFIENNYTVKNLNILGLYEDCFLIKINLLNEKKNSCSLSFDISTKDSTMNGRFIFKNQNEGNWKKFDQKINIENENLSEFKKKFEEKVSEAEKNSAAFFIKLDTLYNALRNFFTADELKKVRMSTEESKKSQEILVDLDENKAVLEETTKKIAFYLAQKYLQIKKLKIIEKKYYVPLLSQQNPFVKISFDLEQDETQKRSIIVFIGYINNMTNVFISSDGGKTGENYELDAQLRF